LLKREKTSSHQPVQASINAAMTGRNEANNVSGKRCEKTEYLNKAINPKRQTKGRTFAIASCKTWFPALVFL
jgi:hypothetical protein